MTHSQARVATERPQRYIKQLCEHLGHRITADWDERQGSLTFPDGRCTLEIVPEGLLLDAQASDDEALAHVEDVTGRHLERFGQRDQLQVQWKR